jgi:hypothetical protein
MLLDIIHVIRTSKAGGGSASPFSLVTLVSLAISVMSLALTFIGAYRNKRVELIAKRFDKLCIDPIEAGFKELDKLFSEHGSEKAADYRNSIATKLTEVNLILVSLRSIYPQLDVNEITQCNDTFSEQYFEGADETVGDYLASYLKAKNEVINLLFKHILEKELLLIKWRRPSWWPRHRAKQRPS